VPVPSEFLDEKYNFLTNNEFSLGKEPSSQGRSVPSPQGT